jgi:predicted nucleic acid-binding protein
MIVVDASVAVKWLVSEKDEDAAEELLRTEAQVAGPAFLRVEVTAAIARKARFGEISASQAASAVELWHSMLRGPDIDLIAEDPDLARALALSLELSHPLQDCVYLALAERLDAPLVTADEKFAAKARRRHPLIRTLASFRP